jgi:hypothetical protein
LQAIRVCLFGSLTAASYNSVRQSSVPTQGLPKINVHLPSVGFARITSLNSAGTLMQHCFCAVSIAGESCRPVLLTDPRVDLIGRQPRTCRVEFESLALRSMQLESINIPIVALILVGIPTTAFFFSFLALTSLSLAPLFAECSGRSGVRR